MEVFSDLHLHSKYSRACSKNLDLENLAYWGKLKGLNLIGTGDFTHPLWLEELKEKLEDNGSGFFTLKSEQSNILFALSCEISSIFSRAGAVKRIHNLVVFPNFNSVEKFNKQLSLYSNLKSDGRPITGIDVKNLLKMVLDVNEAAIFIPTHCWTPWFSLFGSMSGFDSITEAFGELTNQVYAIETGLSSDPPMNWRLSQLDNFQIVSFSDAHSPYPHRIGREATVFELKEFHYKNLLLALKQPDLGNYIKMTVEFYPEEGKYHYDGHRLCGISFSPEESKKNNFLCPVCGKKVTVGVLSRSEKLANRDKSFFPSNRPTFKNCVPLTEIIAKILKSQPTTQKVLRIYSKLIEKFRSEFNVLLNEVNLESADVPKEIIAGIQKAKLGDLLIKPGFDGEYGVIDFKNNTATSRELQRQPKPLF
jgi:uncharacterized protein (TIGR00375 family)